MLTSAAAHTSSVLVPATPFSYISNAAAATIRSRVARPFRVSMDPVYRSGVDTPKCAWLCGVITPVGGSKGSLMTAQTHSIREQAQTLAAGMAAQAPADLIAPFSVEQASLDAAGIPAGVAEPG